jgi:hypothetical protein
VTWVEAEGCRVVDGEARRLRDFPGGFGDEQIAVALELFA